MAKTGDIKRVITVFLLDDHELVRVGVKDFLETQPDIRVIGEAGAQHSAGLIGQQEKWGAPSLWCSWHWPSQSC